METLSGTWSFPSELPGGPPNYIHFQQGRVLHALSDPVSAGKYLPMNLWCEIESPEQIRVRPKPGAEGWTARFVLHSSGLTLFTGDLKFECIRVADAAVPEWFVEFLAKGNYRMDRVEHESAG